jgi:hypothetical protein
MPHRVGLLIALLGLPLISGCAESDQPPAEGGPSPEVVYINADYASFERADDLMAASSTVVVGTVTGSTVQSIDIVNHDPTDDPQLNPGGDQSQPEYMTYTIHQVTVGQVLKGAPAVGDTIEVGEVGGELDGIEYLTDTGILMQPKQTYLLFLEQSFSSRYYPINPIESIYQVGDRGSLRKDERTQLEVDSVARAARYP